MGEGYLATELLTSGGGPSGASLQDELGKGEHGDLMRWQTERERKKSETLSPLGPFARLLSHVQI
jgi:hypothetical protein